MTDLIWPRPYRPQLWLRNGHLQTVLTTFYRPRFLFEGTRRLWFDLPDGGRSSVWLDSPSPLVEPLDLSGHARVAVLLHGLGSHAGGTYMSGVAARLLRRGWTTLRVNTPGAGETAAENHLPPSAASAPSIAAILGQLIARYGVQECTLVGFSLGGVIAINLAIGGENGRFGELPRLQHVWAVAPPIDLAECCRGIEQRAGRFYGQYFTRMLRTAAARRAEQWPAWQIDLTGVRTIAGFDDRVTAPLAGYASAADYYDHNSVHLSIKDLLTPMTIVADRHDPVVPYRVFERAELGRCRLIRTNHGGHLGYFEAISRRGPLRWADEALAAAIDRVEIAAP